MKVTVCELHDERPLFGRDWERLAAHMQSERSELVVLPETRSGRHSLAGESTQHCRY